jgi:glyoxylase-like metal-dependent hydrolase (beta-lactamase superfamily II)
MTNLIVKSFVFNAIQENTYIVSDSTKACMIIDPGCYSAAECNVLADYIKKEQLRVVGLINTHGHIDHVLGNAFVKQTFSVSLAAHRLCVEEIKSVPLYASMYGFPAYQESVVDSFLEEGDTIKFGETALEVLYVPGHAAGHIALYSPIEKKIFSGDVLFRGSVGRTDLPGGNAQVLIKTIKEKMYALPNETIVYCGHGQTTTIGYEKQNNPYVRG